MVPAEPISSPSTDEDSAGPWTAGRRILMKGPWTSAEDVMLFEHVQKHDEGGWNRLQKHMGLVRCGKSCRLRWMNHLKPDLKKRTFKPDEEELIIELHARMGNRWARIASYDTAVMASAAGLCCRNRNSKLFFICNPVTKIHLALPSPNDDHGIRIDVVLIPEPEFDCGGNLDCHLVCLYQMKKTGGNFDLTIENYFLHPNPPNSSEETAEEAPLVRYRRGKLAVAKNLICCRDPTVEDFRDEEKPYRSGSPQFELPLAVIHPPHSDHDETCRGGPSNGIAREDADVDQAAAGQLCAVDVASSVLREFPEC